MARAWCFLRTALVFFEIKALSPAGWVNYSLICALTLAFLPSMSYSLTRFFSPEQPLHFQHSEDLQVASHLNDDPFERGKLQRLGGQERELKRMGLVWLLAITPSLPAPRRQQERTAAVQFSLNQSCVGLLSSLPEGC